ncbi:MAG: hypothetical protein R2712_25755 [Vicinamibacterales bacterium]
MKACHGVAILRAPPGIVNRRISWLDVAFSLDRDLAAVAGARIVFGHQSVGGNILDGLGTVA